MKKKIVAEAMQAKSLKSVSIKYGVARSTSGGWLSNDELNPDKEYARTRSEKKDNPPRCSQVSIKNPKDSITEGIVMAAKTNPEELARENIDLQKKIDYLEDKVAYLEQLYIGSSIVSFMVELTNNYRHNKLAWYEPQDYYSVIEEFEITKQIKMQNTPF